MVSKKAVKQIQDAVGVNQKSEIALKKDKSSAIHRFILLRALEDACKKQKEFEADRLKNDYCESGVTVKLVSEHGCAVNIQSRKGRKSVDQAKAEKLVGNKLGVATMKKMFGTTNISLKDGVEEIPKKDLAIIEKYFDVDVTYSFTAERLESVLTVAEQKKIISEGEPVAAITVSGKPYIENLLAHESVESFGRFFGKDSPILIQFKS